MEKWKTIDGFPDYAVSNKGRVKKLTKGVHKKAGELLKQRLAPLYWAVNLHNGKKHLKRVHRLMATAFIPNPLNLPEVNHKNGIKSDNTLSNLEWCTQSQNTQHAFDTGLEQGRKGIQHHNAKLTESQVFEIKDLLKKGSFSQKKIASMFGVSQPTVCLINVGKNWPHLKETK